MEIVSMSKKHPTLGYKEVTKLLRDDGWNIKTIPGPTALLICKLRPRLPKEPYLMAPAPRTLRVLYDRASQPKQNQYKINRKLPHQRWIKQRDPSTTEVGS